MKRPVAVLLAVLLLAGCWSGRAAPYHVARSLRGTVQVLFDFEAIKDDGSGLVEVQGIQVHGSGVVLWVDYAARRSIVVTARHVVDPHFENWIPQEVAIMEEQVEVRTLSGEVCGARVLLLDPDHDASFLDVSCVAGDPAVLAPGPPEVGGWVYAVGAPDGWHPDGMFAVTDGRFLGRMGDGTIVTSTPVGHGSSGGGLFSDGGLLLGIVVAGNQAFRHIVFSVPAADIAGSFARARGMLDAR